MSVGNFPKYTQEQVDLARLIAEPLNNVQMTWDEERGINIPDPDVYNESYVPVPSDFEKPKIETEKSLPPINTPDSKKEASKQEVIDFLDEMTKKWVTPTEEKKKPKKESKDKWDMVTYSPNVTVEDTTFLDFGDRFEPPAQQTTEVTVSPLTLVSPTLAQTVEGLGGQEMVKKVDKKPGLRSPATDEMKMAIVESDRTIQLLKDGKWKNGYPIETSVLKPGQIYTQEMHDNGVFIHPEEPWNELQRSPLEGKRWGQLDKRYIGKSYETIMAEHKYGLMPLENLKRDHPENKQYQMAVSLDMSTGELKYPRFPEKDLISILRTFPEYQKLKYKKMDDGKFYRDVVEPNYQDLLLQPDEVTNLDILGETMGTTFSEVTDTFGSAAANGFQQLYKAADYIHWFFAGMQDDHKWVSFNPSKVIEDYKKGDAGFAQMVFASPGNYLENVTQAASDEMNVRMKVDEKFQNYMKHVEETPAWGNFFKDERVFTRMFGSIAPSLMMSWGSYAGAFKGAKLLGYSDDIAKQAARTSTFTTMSALEGGGYVQGHASELMMDTPVDENIIAKDLQEYNDSILDEYYIVDELTQKASFPDKQSDVDAQTKPTKTYRDLQNMLNVYYGENYIFQADAYWKKGMSASDAIDAVGLGAAIYGPVAGILETFTAAKAFDALPNSWGMNAVKTGVSKATIGRAEKFLRRVPGGNKLLKIPDSKLGKIINISMTESVEEVSQYFADVTLSSGIPGIRHKSEWDWNWNEAFESGLSGGLGGGISQTAGTIISQNGIRDYLSNRAAVKNPSKQGVQYYTKKQDDGTWGLFYTIDGVESQLKEGDGVLQAGVKDSYGSFRAANKQARALREEERKMERENIVRSLGKYKDAKVGEVTLNEDSKKYEVEILNKEGGTIIVEEFDTSLSAKTGRRNMQTNINNVNKIAEEDGYSDDDILNMQDTDAPQTPQGQADAETAKNAVLLKTYLSEPMSEAELQTEAELENEGRLDEANIEEEVFKAISDPQALQDSGLSPDAIIKDIQEDFGPDAADRARNIMQPPVVVTPETGPAPDDQTPPGPSPTTDEQAPPSPQPKPPGPKNIEDMSVKQLKERIKSLEGKTDPFSKIALKVAKKELDKRKGKASTKTTVEKVKIKQMEKKVEKIQDKQIKRLMQNLLQGKEGEDLLQGVEAIDEKILTDVIERVNRQQFMGKDWIEESSEKLQALSAALISQKDEKAKAAIEASERIKKERLYEEGRGPRPEGTIMKEEEVPIEAAKKFKSDLIKLLTDNEFNDSEALGDISVIFDTDMPHHKDLAKTQEKIKDEIAKMSPVDIYRMAEVDLWKDEQGVMADIVPDEMKKSILETKKTAEAKAKAKKDVLLYDAAKLAIQNQQASVSLLQKWFKIGYSRAGGLIDELEELGIVSGYNYDKPRDVLVDMDWLEKNKKNILAEDFETDETPPSKRYQRAVKFKSRTKQRKEAIRRNIDDIVKHLEKVVVLADGKKIKVEYIDDVNAEKAEWDGEKIIINLAKADETSPVHEFMHPFIESLYVKNRSKFDEIFDELKDTPIGQTVIAHHIEKTDIDENHPMFKIEVVIESIARTFRMKKDRAGNPFVDAVKRFLQWLKSVFFPKATHISTYDITPGTTVQQLAEMLGNYYSPPVFEVFDRQEVNRQIEAMIKKHNNLATMVSESEVLDSDSEIKLTNAYFETLYSQVLARKIKDSLTNKGNIHKAKFKKNTKNIYQDIINELKEQYSIELVDSDASKVMKEMSEGNKEMMVDAIGKVQNMLALQLDTGEYDIKDAEFLLPKPTKKEADTLNQYQAEAISAIQFKYKFADYLKSIETQDVNFIHIPKAAQLKKKEANAVKGFLTFLKSKFKKQKSMPANEMLEHYIEFVDTNYGLNLVQTMPDKRYSSMLSLDAITGEFDDKIHTRRMVVVGDFVHQGKHAFEIDHSLKVDPLINGMGWFAYNYVGPNKDLFLWEYQSDIMDDLRRSYLEGRYELTYEELASNVDSSAPFNSYVSATRKLFSQVVKIESEYSPVEDILKRGFITKHVAGSKESDDFKLMLKNFEAFKNLFNEMEKGTSVEEIKKKGLHILNDNYVLAYLIIENAYQIGNIDPSAEYLMWDIEGLLNRPDIIKKAIPILKEIYQSETSLSNYQAEHKHQISYIKDKLESFDPLDFEGNEIALNDYLQSLDNLRNDLTRLEREVELMNNDFISYLDIGLTMYLNTFLGNVLNNYQYAKQYQSSLEALDEAWAQMVPEGESKVQSKAIIEKDFGVPGLVPGVVDLYDNWFDILIRTSLGFAQNSVGNDGSIYLNTGNAISAIQGNQVARGIYLTPDEAFIDNFILMVTDVRKKRYSIDKEGKFEMEDSQREDFKVDRLADSIFGRWGDSEHTLLMSKDAGGPDFEDLRFVLKELKPYKSIVKKWLAWKKNNFDESTKNLTKEQKKNLTPPFSDPRGGIWWQKLASISKEGIIKLEMERPEWSQWDLIKVTILQSGKLNPSRFQSAVKEAKENQFKPKTEEEVYDKVENISRYQSKEVKDNGEYKTSRNARAEAKHLFDGAWGDIKRVTREQGYDTIDPFDFRTSMLNALGVGSMETYFEDWFAKKFKEHPDLKIRQKSKGSNNGTIINPEDVDSAVSSLFNDEAIREGMDSIIESGESDERDIGINERIWMHELRIYLSEGSLKALKRKARKSPNFEWWAKNVFPVYSKRTFKSLTYKQQQNTIRFYDRINSYIVTNQPKGKGNQRDNYNVMVYSDYTKKDKKGKFIRPVPEIKVRLKDGENIKTGNQNPYAEKITLFEQNEMKDLFKWVGGEDILNVNRTSQGEFVTDIYGFLNDYQYEEMQEAFNKQNLAVAFMRGEGGRLALVRITEKHKQIAATSLKSYIETERENGFIPVEDIYEEHIATAEDIAIHEAMKKVWPLYLFDAKGAANVIKRIKIPFTPVTTMPDMPSFKVKIFDPSRASFVFDGGKVVSDATVVIDGVGEKYIMDGGSLASRSLWNNLEKNGGILRESGSSKNVIYNTEGLNTLMVKHEMNIAPRNFEIWYDKGTPNEKLIAKIDNNRNIEDVDGNSIDLLMTPDEAKVRDGYGMDVIHEVPGSSIGLISYRDKASKTATHGTQWYGYVTDDNVIQSFEDNIIRDMNQKMAKLWNMSVDTDTTKAADKISEYLISILETNDNEGYRLSVTEHAKLGAGLHPGMEPMLNVLLQSKGMKKIAKAGLQPGSRVKITGNLRGDLDPNEVALSKNNATPVYQAYAKDKAISLTEARKVSIKKINEWLEDNEVNMMVTRYPVPHVGAVLVARVKRLHSRHGLIEMNPFDVYAKLEGDMDGDEVQVEKLAPEQESIIKEYLSKLNIKGINLNNFVPKDRDKLIFSDKKARDKINTSLAYGATAIGEIANLMNVYGQLSRVFDHAIVDGNKVVLKKLDEKSKVFFGKIETEMTVREVLRHYIQAALDNAEFMLLKEWRYDLKALYSFLFKREDGKPFRFVDREGLEDSIYQGELVYNALKPLIEMHKIPGRLRSGKDFENGKYDLDAHIIFSERFRDYTLDRLGWFMDNYEFDVHVGSILSEQDIVFKEDILPSPWEMTAIAPIKSMEEHIAKYERRGIENTPFEINKILADNAHLDTVAFLDTKIDAILNRAFDLDMKAGLVKISKEAFLTQEKRKGLVYRQEMGNAWFDVLVRLKKLGPQTVERNDDIVTMKDKYNKEFKSLSKTAKVIATMGFLRGFINMSNNLAKRNKAVRVFKFLPPASNNNNEIQLLDESILKMFYKEYNKTVSSPDKRSLKEGNKLRNWTSFDTSIKRVCK